MSRRGRDESEKAVEVVVGEQLASDSYTLKQGKTDVRRLSKINEIEAFVFPYFLIMPNYRGGRAARKIVDNKLNLNMSIDGWRASQLIKLVAGSKGVSTMEFAKRPGVLARNVWKRGWKEKAERQGKDIVE